MGQRGATVNVILWITVDKEEYDCPVLPDACPFCGEACIALLPLPLAAKQIDGTTHVCHPSIGGCNHGFRRVAPTSN